MNSIIIFGGTGFIGKHLVNELQQDYNIIVFSRSPEKAEDKLPASVTIMQLDLNSVDTAAQFFDEADAVINLAGENIGGGRWTESFKEKIKQSRKAIDELIVSAFNKSKNKPATIIQGSAIGIYGTANPDKEITESSPVSTSGLLASVASAYESNLKPIEKQTRLVFLRTGIVLDKNEGALPQMALPFKLFAGGRIGNGKQFLSWIHIKDQVNVIRFILENHEISGPINLTSPNPVTQAEFAKALSEALNRPAFLPAPAFMLKLILGREKAKELLLSGMRVVPEKLNKSGFSFQFENIFAALHEIYG